jgi:hypothetical protein
LNCSVTELTKFMGTARSPSINTTRFVSPFKPLKFHFVKRASSESVIGGYLEFP